MGSVDAVHADIVKGRPPPVGRARLAAGAALVAPATVLLILLLVVPLAGIFVLAATDWQLGAPDFDFVGFANFQAMWADAAFRAALVNTAIYVAVVVPATLAVGLAVALLIEAGRHFRAIYRAVHFLPVMATLAAMAIAWEALLHPTIGLVNQVLRALGLSPPNWLSDPDVALLTLCIVGVWQHLGYAMVLFIAGLKAIPRDLYEAADIDGADRGFDRFLTVTFPLLGPVTMFLVIVVSIKAFETFDTVAILTGGGPGHASELLLHTLYVESFRFFRTGYGSAMTVVFLFVVVALTLLQARALDKRVHYS